MSEQLGRAERRGIGHGVILCWIGGAGLDVRSDLGGLNLSDVPKVFIETGNMRNATDARLLSRPAFRQRIARSLANGLSSFLS